MARLTFDITMSLDGYVAGPNMTPDQGLGEGGEHLHEWAIASAAWRKAHGRTGGQDDVDSEVIEESLRNVGAHIMGRRMFGGEGDWDNKAWGDQPWEGWWGAEPPFHKPVFVLTTHPREPLVKGETTFTFVTDGIESALSQAQAAAGGEDVVIAGGASAVQQYLKAGLVDDFQVHVVPLLLGKGVPLFDDLGPEPPVLECTRVLHSPAVTHLQFRVAKVP
jgi:dihydrofolate reductase